MTYISSINRALCSLEDIKAFEDNVSIKSSLSYNVSAKLLTRMLYDKRPLTIKATRTLLLLPEDRMRPRHSDSRMGVFLTFKQHISNEKDQDVYKRQAVWLAYFLSCPWIADAGSRDKKKKRVPEVKVEQSDYDKLFKGKRYDTAISEFMAVHLSLIHILTANVRAQKEKVNLNLKEVSMKTLFEEIQRQTSFYFVFSAEQTQRLGMFTVEAKNESLENVLNRVFANTGFVYELSLIHIFQFQFSINKLCLRIYRRG